MPNWEIFARVVFSLVAAVVTWQAVAKSKKDEFYTDTHFLWPLGIFIWGDALILGPFWLVSSLLFWWLSPVMILRFWLVFVIFRSFYEVCYWIGHQMVNKEYRPPLFRNVKWLKTNDVAILYQLMNMCQVVVAVMLLIMSFN